MNIEKFNVESLKSRNRMSIITIPMIDDPDMIERIAEISANCKLVIDELTVAEMRGIAKTARDELMQEAVESAERQLAIF